MPFCIFVDAGLDCWHALTSYLRLLLTATVVAENRRSTHGFICMHIAWQKLSFDAGMQLYRASRMNVIFFPFRFAASGPASNRGGTVASSRGGTMVSRRSKARSQMTVGSAGNKSHSGSRYVLWPVQWPFETCLHPCNAIVRYARAHIISNTSSAFGFGLKQLLSGIWKNG